MYNLYFVDSKTPLRLLVLSKRMNRHFHPLKLPYFAILIFIANHFLTISCARSDEYTSCSRSHKCGDMDITYPFYGAETRPAYCGYPGFEVSCVADVLRIDILSLTYRILEIDSRTHTLTVARDDYWGDYCVDLLYNTTILEGSIFQYGSTTAQYQLSLYYSCNSSVSTMMSAAHQFNCTHNETSNTGYYWTYGPSSQVEVGIATLLGACKDTVNLPIFKSGFATLNSHPSLDNLFATIRGGFGLEWSAHNSLCDSCLISGGSCGRKLPSSEFVCYCTDINAYASICDSYNPPAGATHLSDSGALSLKVKVVIGVVSSVSPFIIFFFICCLRKKCVLVRENDVDINAFLDNCGSLAPKQYKYSDVQKMTNSFRHKLGQGGYGYVYKGSLSDGKLVAVKVLSDSKGNGEDFLNEVASISRTSHVNVVTLLGFSYERNKRALIYEFMPKGSLDRYIYMEPSSNAKYHLGWRTLSKIATGIARGLEYLHSGCNTRILHFDIKPHNILLDQDFCPKISDFGLARLCKKKESIISMVGMRGTIGYIAPEVVSRLFGGVSYKSDVYSYGMMLLEMARGGQKIEAGLSQTSEIYFPHWVYKQLKLGVLRLDRITNEDEEVIARKMILVGLWCIQTKPSDRPSMMKVVEMLEGGIESLQIPPNPVICSPQRSTHQYSSTLSSLS